MDPPDYKDLEIATLKAQVKALSIDRGMRIRQYFLEELKATDPRYLSCCFVIEVRLKTQAVYEKLKELGAIDQNGFSTTKGCQILFCFGPGQGKLGYVKGNGNKTVFVKQNACKVDSVSFLPGWNGFSYRVTGEFVFQELEPCKAFYLPIVDRVIACDTINNPPKIVDGPTMYNPPRPAAAEEMILPVGGIFWDLRWWEVTEIRLWSPDRQKIVMTIDDCNYSLTDEELVRVIY